MQQFLNIYNSIKSPNRREEFHFEDRLDMLKDFKVDHKEENGILKKENELMNIHMIAKTLNLAEEDLEILLNFIFDVSNNLKKELIFNEEFFRWFIEGAITSQLIQEENVDKIFDIVNKIEIINIPLKRINKEKILFSLKYKIFGDELEAVTDQSILFLSGLIELKSIYNNIQLLKDVINYKFNDFLSLYDINITKDALYMFNQIKHITKDTNDYMIGINKIDITEMLAIMKSAIDEHSNFELEISSKDQALNFKHSLIKMFMYYLIDKDMIDGNLIAVKYLKYYHSDLMNDSNSFIKNFKNFESIDKNFEKVIQDWLELYENYNALFDVKVNKNFKDFISNIN